MIRAFLVGVIVGIAVNQRLWVRRIRRTLAEDAGREVTATVSTPSGTYTIRGRMVTDEGDDGIVPPDAPAAYWTMAGRA